MASRWMLRTLAVLGALVVLALGGCSSDDGAGGTSDGGSGGGSASDGGAQSSAEPSGGGSAPSSSSTDDRTPECSTGDLSAAYRGGQGAAGHTIGRIVLTDASDHACLLQGFGGLSYVGGGSGKQVGAAADRDDTGSSGPVTLQPGGSASSEVSEAEAGNYGAGQCDPTPVDGFRVYPPDQTASLFVKHPTTGCASRSVHLLSHQPYH